MDFIRAAVERVVGAHVVCEGRQTDVDAESLVEEARVNFPIGELNADDLEGKSPDDLTAMLFSKVVNLYEQKEVEIGRVVLKFIKQLYDDLRAGRPPQQLKLVDAQRQQMGIGQDNQSVERWLNDSVALLTRFEQGQTDLALARQVAAYGAPTLREWERVITLRAIDEHWIDHLNMLDHLRSGVSLRGYGQQDPVVVYAQEAFEAFEDMKHTIQLDVIRKLFTLRLAEPMAPGLTDERGRRISEHKIAPKIGRNTKCYCGSGKKYKQCHLPQDEGNPPDNWPQLYEQAYGEAPVVKN
jgi:preprotein translocase subunit SecA